MFRRMRPFLPLFLLAIKLPSFAVQSPATTTPSIFDFHSGFWVNLHHFLYLEALSEHPENARRPATLSPEDLAILCALTAHERAVWDEAVAYYADNMIQHDLLSDRDLAAMQFPLIDAESSPNLANAQLPPELKAILLQAAPIYRSHWWPRHDRQNRAWIAGVQPLIAKYGDGLKNSLATIYETPWPTEPIRADAVIYANWAGAYTTIYPTRITIATSEPVNPEAGALESLFHEGSHGMMEKVQDAIDAATKSMNAQHPDRNFAPGTIWHAVLFYTAGALVAQRFPGYIPYADKNGLWKRAWPDPDRTLIAQDWQPHIDGKIALQPALTKLIDDVAAASSK